MDSNVTKLTPALYDHQKQALLHLEDKTAYALFLEQGTGKSAIIIHEATNMIDEGKINCVVVIAPNNVHINWANEFLIHCRNPDKIGIQIWKSGQNISTREKETRAILNSKTRVLVFLMNIEAISTENGRSYLRRILQANKRTYMVIDESHKIKNPSALRTKSAIELGRLAKYRRIATGTEAEEGIENLFSQFRFLDPNIIGIRSYTAFKSMFCVMGGFENREIKAYQNEALLAGRIAPYIYAKRKKDCLDLPDKVYVAHAISPTVEQFRIYRQLEEELILELSNGTIVDASMALVRMMRLQQILCGHINGSDDASTRLSLPVPSNRAAFVAELVEEASSKVIIFCRFIMDVSLVGAALANASIGFVGISSQTTGSRMDEIDRWRNDPALKALVITTATGGTGLTLNEATTTIFYSNSWSSTDRIQAEDRNHRIGQNDKVTYHDIYVNQAIDHRLLKVLRDKKSAANEFRSLTNIQKFITEPI